jgi:hypothetical protein
VTYHEWERLGTPRAKREHIAKLLERAKREDARRGESDSTC